MNLDPFVCLIVYNFVIVTIFIIYGFKLKWEINSTLYILFFLIFSGIISTLYWNASNGTIRNYANITLPPFLYLILCYFITLYPIMKYDLQKCSMYVSIGQKEIIDKFTVFIIIVSFEPFLENLFYLPTVLANSKHAANMYDMRLNGVTFEYLSFIGRKLNRISTSFELVYPILLFYNLSKKKINSFLLIGLLMVILSFWMHELGLGGRSKLVQNILYVLVVYFLMKRYVNPDVNKKIVKYGLIVIGVGVAIIMIISLSRFASLEEEGTNVDSVWLWLGLYAGEGILNFNSLMWDVTKSTDGNSTFILIKTFLLGGDDITVADHWNAVAKLGIPGNIFYTYVGSIYEDFNSIGTIVFILIFSYFTVQFTKIKKGVITLPKIIILCFCARILVVPTFYTYSTLMSQLNLFCSLCFCFVLYISNKKLM